ncbi:rhoptry protein [Lysinibacillus contaminans]|uniref:Rhoptry protein n=1 Tax=Lysinibacillus contaminans TaxID=1293441 RepID=A0ABR5JZK6_9BACI|nr:hypothetical protein [Lysinibacillus contaminans]KOS68083.1 rhoptry protein [Lysinibacillus contaminans]
MNKKLLFAVAAIPVIFVAPTVTGAENLSGITITGTASVNGTLTASISNLPVGTTIKGYQWYYIEEKSGDGGSTTRKPISGATQATFKLPAEAAGKTITVEATDTNSNKYEGDSRVVKELALAITAPTFEGHSASSFVAPGETVKITGADVTDKAGAELESSQITYSYQWFYKVGEQFTIISGATDRTYKVPADALDKKMINIIVKATAKVGTSVVVSDFSHMLTVSNEASNTMIEDIGKLRVSDSKYNFTDLAVFTAEVKALESKYQALADAAKANVTNYVVLKRALADVEAINALNEKVNKVDVSDKDLPKHLKDIEEAYDKLDLLQRSLDVGDILYNNIRAMMKEPTDIVDIAQVRILSQAIVDLLNYDNNVIKYVPTSVESLQAAVEKIEADIAKLSKSYQTTVQNQAILNEAKQDIKKIAQFIKLFEKLSGNIAPDKQVTTAKSIRTAYEKLTYKQLQLVPDTYVTKLLEAENAEETQIATINTEIDSYIGDDIYPINPTAETWQAHVSNVNRIIASYKNLTTNSEAKVIGYAAIVTLQKDLKTAEKIIKQIEEYNALTAINGVKESKLESSYNSALKAYNKLTSLQQSLVYNEDKLLNNPPNMTVDNNGKEPADKAAAEVLKADIAKFADLTKYSFTQLETAVNTATTTYKNLSSAARKYVTNYYLLTAASKDVKAVVSFHKKVQAAREETDVAKQAKKIESVEKAYAKLPANQQHLAKEQYQLLLDKRPADGNASDIVTLNTDIGKMVSNGLYTVTIEGIQQLSAQYKKLSTSDKKLITNASILKTAEADVKKVESFMKQYDKSFEKSPATVVKAFAKLTAKQMNLVSENVRQKIIEAEKGQQGANETAFGLVESINTLLQNGVYKANLQADVTIIRTAYDKLSASEKSVVKNYSKLTQAEADLKKVAEVHTLYEAITAENSDTARKAWETAFAKLSKKLELLYTDMYKGDK